MHVPAAPGAPANPVRGIPLAGRRAVYLDHTRALDGAIDRRAVARVWEAALAAPPWDRAPVWLHGDLHPANILVHGGRISGVIDFGDITAGDPATDLAVAWMLLPPGARDIFRATYTTTGGHATTDARATTSAHASAGGHATAGGRAADNALWTRARGWALVLSLAMLANSADNPLIAGIGHRTLDAVLG